MRKENIIFGSTIVAVIIIAFIIFIPKQNSGPSINLQQRLTACGSFPNGSTENATETSRIFINIPKDIYPNVNLEIMPHGAVANYISNGGQYGYALGEQGKPNCWSYYFEFDLASSSKASGGIDISSKSGVEGIPDYLIHINVTGLPTAISTSTPSLRGEIQGQILLGPTCPVEHTPPDPNCIPKGYQTKVIAFKADNASNPYDITTSNASGTFILALDPGAYVLRAGSGASYPRCADMPIQVVAGKSQSITINCDTGIR